MPKAVESDRDFMRGVIVSCPRFGQIWGSPEMTTTVEELSELGVEWISIHPYGGVRRSGEVRHWKAAETGYLDRAVEIVREAGMKLFWKPHLAYWGSFEWRGAIDFGDNQTAWKRFFEDYEEYIVDQAKFAQKAGVELFAVGVELEGTTKFEAEWRRIVERVRTHYKGQILYAANWDSLERVPFWDALDVIGVHAYFPLSGGTDPDTAAIRSAWDGPLATLDALSRRHDKPIVFAEIGYNRSHRAAIAPWEYEMHDTPESRELRRRLMDVALERVESAESVHGMFWWKWIPGNSRWDRDFSMRNPEARDALSESWGRYSSQEP